MACGGCGGRGSTAVRVVRNTRKTKLKNLTNSVIVVRHSAKKSKRPKVGRGKGGGVRVARGSGKRR